MEPTTNIPESILAGRILIIMAGRVSDNLATFSSWLVGSFAAMLALLFTNIEKVSQFVSAKCVGTSASLFLLAVGLHVLQRYLSAIVSGSVAVAKEVEALPKIDGLNPVVVMQEIEKSTLWPGRILVSRMLKKVQSGDIAAGGRMNAKLAQVQGFLVLGQMAAVIGAAYVLASAL